MAPPMIPFVGSAIGVVAKVVTDARVRRAHHSGLEQVRGGFQGGFGLLILGPSLTARAAFCALPLRPRSPVSPYTPYTIIQGRQEEREVLMPQLVAVQEQLDVSTPSSSAAGVQQRATAAAKQARESV